MAIEPQMVEMKCDIPVPYLVIMGDGQEYRFVIINGISMCKVLKEHVDKILKVEIGKVYNRRLGFTLL